MGSGQRVVLYVHSGASRYGSDRCLLEIVSRLDRGRYQPVVALPHEGPLHQELLGRGLEVHLLPVAVIERRLSPGYLCRLPFRIAASTRVLAWFMRERGVDLVHSNTSHVLSSGPAARRAGVPHLHHVREIPRLPGPVRRAFAARVGRYATEVVAISGAVRDGFLGSQVRRDRVRVIHDGIDLAPFAGLPPRREMKRQLGFDEEAPLVGMAGRLTPWKGHRYFVEAAAQLARQFPRATFVIAGEADTDRNRAYRAELQAAVRRLGLEERIRFLGFRRDAPALMAAMDVFVLPSATPEPLGLVVLEAMAAGTPVVATAHGGPVELLAEGKLGLLVPPANGGAIAEAVARLLDDPEQRARLSALGRERVQEFSVEAHVAALMQVYDELLGDRVAAPAVR